MASIDKRGATWRARYRTPDGRSRSQAFRRKIDAQAFLNEVGHARNTGAFVDPEQGRLTLAAWHQRWWASTVDLRPSTRDRVEGIVRLMSSLASAPGGSSTSPTRRSRSGLLPCRHRARRRPRSTRPTSNFPRCSLRL